MQRIQRWYPINDFRNMQYALDRMQPRFAPDAAPTMNGASDPAMNGASDPATNGASAPTWSVPLDITTKGEDTVVRASLPGVAPEDIQVSIEDHVLTIKGKTDEKFQDFDGEFVMRERRTGAFARALRLPDSVDPEKVQPHYEHGILTITLPKSEAKRARQLPIMVGTGPVIVGS